MLLVKALSTEKHKPQKISMKNQTDTKKRLKIYHHVISLNPNRGLKKTIQIVKD